MRFNGKELSYIVQHAESKFDQEDVLLIKEKQEGLFRKGEVFVERLFRLKGNLLFYFKTKDSQSEPIGLIVLERCLVELCEDEDQPFCFTIVYESEERPLILAAVTDEQRSVWIAALHLANCESLRLQIRDLQEKIWAKTGRDPLVEPPESAPESELLNKSDEPFLEICVACHGLPLAGNQQPDTFVTIQYYAPNEQNWVTYKHTEVIQHCRSPTFMTTVPFFDTIKFNPITRLKLYVSSVKEVMTNTVIHVGFAIFTIRDIIDAPNKRLQLKLHASDFQDVGYVTIMGWDIQTADEAAAEAQAVQASASVTTKRVLERRVSIAAQRHMEMLRPLFANVIGRVFHFPTSTGEKLRVQEYMGESKMTYLIPRQLLKLWIEEEKDWVERLKEVGKMTDSLNRTRKELSSLHQSNINMYTQQEAYLQHFEIDEITFKPSSKKEIQELEFIPTNLHLQRLRVENLSNDTVACYDVITVGAFTALSQKFKQGGLSRQIKALNESQTVDFSASAGLTQPSLKIVETSESLNKTMNNVTNLYTVIRERCKAMCQAANQGSLEQLRRCMQELADKVCEMVEVCSCSPLKELMAEFLSVKSQQVLNKKDKSVSSVGMVTDSSRSSHPVSMPMKAWDTSAATPRAHSVDLDAFTGGSPANSAPLPNDATDELNWKWTGHNLLKSPTVEPWDMTCPNLQAAMLCISSKIDEMVAGQTEPSRWLENINSPVISLQQQLDVMCSRARCGLTYGMLKACDGRVSQLHIIKMRRDVACSQAMTSMIAGFVTRIRSAITDEGFLQQMFKVGVLAEFESLLSCYGDEMGMLEDMIIALADLSLMRFRLVKEQRPGDIMPRLEGGRAGYIVNVPLPASMFSLLPRELQHGHLVSVVPVFFSVGINEQATLAESKIGDTALQEAINREGYDKLRAYYDKYTAALGNPPSRGKNSLSPELLMRYLHLNVMAKKSKNVELLQQAQEICWCLNGIRFTSCKSAKDRTSMSVTLEQVQLLQREHDLAAHVFQQALDCMRSEGVRRENALKNAGVRKYAFNTIQLLSFPRQYKPPNGTYGNVAS